jgi:peptide/nickel transport system substrate-binding protein
MCNDDQERFQFLRRCRSWLYGICACLLLGVSFAGAAGAGEPAADPGSTLIYFNATGNQTLDPADAQNNSSYAHDALLAIYDPLIRLDPSGIPTPGLAKSWYRGPDLMDITLKLRTGVTFHDGTNFNAAAVVRNFERNIALGRKAGSSIVETMGLIRTIEVDDTDTVTLRFNAPNGQIEAWLGGTSGMMVSPTALADGTTGAALKPIGTGPFKVTSFDSNVQMVATRNDDYWDGAMGRPAGFEHHYVPDGRARLNAVRSGQATVALLDARQIPEARSAGLAVQVNEKNAVWVLYFNTSRAGLDDVRVRQAFNYAIDREALAEALTFGSSRATGQLFASTSPLNVKAIDARYPYDPSKARMLLAESGHKDGIDITMLLLNNTEFRPIGEALQSMLGDVGIRVKFDMIDVSQFPLFFQKPARGDMMLGRYGGRSDPVQMLFELVATGGPFAPGGAASPRIDQLISLARGIDGADPRRISLLRELAGVVSETAAIVPLMTRANIYAYRSGCVQNLVSYLPAGADRFSDVRIGAGCR